MTPRVLKASSGVVLTENTLSDGKNILNRTYSVTTPGVLQPHVFSTLGEADNHFEEELQRILNSMLPATHARRDIFRTRR